MHDLLPRLLALLALLILVALAVLVIEIYRSWSEIAETAAQDAGSYCLHIGPSGPDEGRCAGYWDARGKFHYMHEDGTWVD